MNLCRSSARAVELEHGRASPPGGHGRPAAGGVVMRGRCSLKIVLNRGIGGAVCDKAVVTEVREDLAPCGQLDE